MCLMLFIRLFVHADINDLSVPLEIYVGGNFNISNGKVRLMTYGFQGKGFSRQKF